MSKVLLKNINPLRHVDLPLIGRQGEVDDVEGSGCLIPGEVFEVDAEVAGQAPFWRPATEDDAEALRYGHIASRTSGEGDEQTTEVLDLGYGLLAQVGNYELAKATKTKAETAANPKG